MVTKMCQFWHVNILVGLSGGGRGDKVERGGRVIEWSGKGRGDRVERGRKA